MSKQEDDARITPLDAALATPFSLAGRRILVAGAAGGIGSAAATVCLGQGADIVLIDIVDPHAFRQRGVPATGAVPYYAVDVADRRAVAALAETVGPIWAVIDATGISPLDDWMSDDWEESFNRVVDVNLRGPINLARAFMPGMIAAGGGRFVLTGSVSGRMGGISCGPHYAGTKGGVHSLTRWLAQKGIKHDVLVNAVAPGSIATPMAAGMKIDPAMYPQGRAGRPLEVGATMAFLCSPAAGFISGAVIDMNGGTYFG